MRRVQERFVAGNRIRLLRDGAEAFPVMLEAIAGARRQILFEMYWFDSDRIGRRFAAALLAAAGRGVEVALIYDAVGSFTADPEMFTELARGGVKVIEFNPVAPWKRRFRLQRLSRRDHRKILVVDGRLGFTGGINIADQWLPEEEEGGGWRDDMVCVEGPAVHGFVQSFVKTWRSEGGAALGPTPTTWTAASECDEASEAAEGQRVRVLGEGFFFRNRHTISRAYLAHLYRAQRRAWLANSYFVPDRSVVRALVRAARRGVDVRIIVPDESDVPIANWASRAVWSRLLRNGVRIFQWSRSILHSKTAVVDGRWSTIGTFNLDHLSLRVNLEVNVAVLDEGFAATMEASFERDLLECREVDLRSFQYRSLGSRLLEFIAYRFRKFL
ncbi:MAG TPA: phospholipase D-like domain-containing protein [Polyangiaceae bacterium]